jgi:hypothetical protein
MILSPVNKLQAQLSQDQTQQLNNTLSTSLSQIDAAMNFTLAAITPPSPTDRWAYVAANACYTLGFIEGKGLLTANNLLVFCQSAGYDPARKMTDLQKQAYEAGKSIKQNLEDLRKQTQTLLANTKNTYENMTAYLTKASLSIQEMLVTFINARDVNAREAKVDEYIKELQIVLACLSATKGRANEDINYGGLLTIQQRVNRN